MNSKTIEIEEKSIDEAIEKACREFGVPREKLNIEIISEESGGFWGIFSKKAKIRASLLSLNIDFSFTDNKEDKQELKIETQGKTEKESPSERKIVTDKPKKQVEPTVVSDSTSNPTLALKAKELLDGILQRIPLDCRVTVNETTEKIILNIEGDNSGLLIGKRGQNIDALQYILNKAINKLNNVHKMIMIDSGEYRKRREEFLLGLAERIREKVKKQ